MNKVNIDNIIFEKIKGNFYNIKNKRTNKYIKYKLKNVFLPFGLDEEYNNYYLKFELENNNIEHGNFKNTMLELENKIKNDFSCTNNEFKNIIKLRDEKKDLLVCRLKKFKNNININITYDNKEEGYLKTIFEINKNVYTDIEIEVNNLWDFRHLSKEENKLGLLIYITKIHVYN